MFSNHSVNSDPDKVSAVIRAIISEEGTGEGMDGTNVSKTYSKTIDIVPYMKYDIQLEVLMNDLGASHEKIKDVTLNGISIGECNPKCDDDKTESECDYACTFYDCTSFLTTTTISSGTGSLDVKLRYQGHSRDCDCDKDSWQCEKENSNPSLTPMVAVARITLIPTT